MNLLAIDTVTEMCSAALLVDGNLGHCEIYAPQQHTRLILGMVDELISNASIKLSELDAIAFSRGPGSFTGLRICASVTQGLALAHDLPVLPVSSLAALAQGCLRQDQQQNVMSCIDARKNEVYCACYEEQNGVMVLVDEEQVGAPGEVSTAHDIAWFGAGSGFAAYLTELKENTRVNVTSEEAERYPLARDVLPIAEQMYRNRQYVDVSLALPVYLRDNVAEPSRQNTSN